MNTILLRPTDVLFFRDGRPMSASLAGHGAAWPMPNVINAAFHAALHRADLGANGAAKLHAHRRGARGVYAEDAERDRKFGSLITAGPFPVRNQETWFFPCALDVLDATTEPALLPTDSSGCSQSSLPGPLKYAVATRLPPSKESPGKPWWSKAVFETYLGTANPKVTPGQMRDHTAADADIFDREHMIGITIDPESGTTGAGQTAGGIYSAHYLRLRETWQLGVCAVAEDKEFRHPEHGNDLVKTLLDGGRCQIVVGGQQRICSALCLKEETLPFPRGRVDDFEQRDSKFLVKWILLSPALWPAINAAETGNIKAHPGGWLPNWTDPQTGKVLLKSGDTARRPGEWREAWRQRVRQQECISGQLVAAVIPKPLTITGWGLSDQATGESGGAQSAHLAVPAGAVYYFEANSADDARNLAAALNWHGCDSKPTTIKNRRTTLLGEKGFGLGVCGTWQFYKNVPGRSKMSQP